MKQLVQASSAVEVDLGESLPLPGTQAYKALPQFPKRSALPFRRTIRRQELRQIVPLAETTIYEMERRDEFPRRFNLTPRCIVWTWPRLKRGSKPASKPRDETSANPMSVCERRVLSGRMHARNSRRHSSSDQRLKSRGRRARQAPSFLRHVDLQGARGLARCSLPWPAIARCQSTLYSRAGSGNCLDTRTSAGECFVPTCDGRGYIVQLDYI